jgi:hypothetical protein
LDPVPGAWTDPLRRLLNRITIMSLVDLDDAGGPALFAAGIAASRLLELLDRPRVLA